MTKYSQEQFNEDILSTVEDLSYNVKGITGSIAGLMLRLDKLEGLPLNRELQKIWLDNTAETLERAEKRRVV